MVESHKRDALWASLKHKAVGRDFFAVCKTAADCHLRPANCVHFMNLSRRSRIRRGRPKAFLPHQMKDSYLDGW